MATKVVRLESKIHKERLLCDVGIMWLSTMLRLTGQEFLGTEITRKAIQALTMTYVHFVSAQMLFSGKIKVKLTLRTPIQLSYCLNGFKFG